MKIYTKTGDSGETGTLGQGRISKSSELIEAIGNLDELNACLGVAASFSKQDFLIDEIRRVQGHLFEIGAELASGGDEKYHFQNANHETDVLEKEIDDAERNLAPLKGFILPGGRALGSHLHLARTICRRLERSVIKLSGSFVLRQELNRYLNRLSDWLFVMARWANHWEGEPEANWRKNVHVDTSDHSDISQNS